jgi:2-aminoadipate transaminase
MSLWVRLPDGLDAETLLAEALREGVSYRAGRVFSVTTPQPAGLRLCFAAEAPERVREGIRRLAVVAGRVRAVEEARAMV